MPVAVDPAELGEVLEDLASFTAQLCKLCRVRLFGRGRKPRACADLFNP